jgi:hypothetical protein
MDTSTEMTMLQAEVLAHEHILIGLLIGLTKIGETGHAVVVNAFSYAESVTDISAMKLGPDLPKLHFERASKVIEHIRTMALGDDGHPKGVV